jgi:hypothetical protein
MKKIYSIIAAIALTVNVFAQAPEKMSYQAVIRDAGNVLVANQSVGMQISILQGSIFGASVYVESQTPTTNINGLVSVEIGSGTLVFGAFSTIDWSAGPYFIKTETDPTGGSTYTITGTSQLMNVPYALYAKTSGSSTPGPQGAAGANGTDGAVGSTGLTGLTGAVGTNGLDGSVGSTGPQGVAGTNGTDGSVGATGSTGTTGLTGPQGLTGAAGTFQAGTTAGEMNYWNGSAWVLVAPTASDAATLQMIGGVPTWVGGIGVVVNPTTGKTWMDRNLGATQVATSSTDEAAYGDLYQWGRGADGHQIRATCNDNISYTLSSTDQPEHGKFIVAYADDFFYDWRSQQNNNLWQGVNGVNNPCPSGYRIPTDPELNAERLSWSVNTSVGAFASVLKLPMAGERDWETGLLYKAGTNGYYWSSTVSYIYVRYLSFSSGGAGMNQYFRAAGNAVRCLKD